MVIFGAGGDLTNRLLVPALYNLCHTGLLPEHFAIVGVDIARTGCQGLAATACATMLQSFVGNASSESRIDAIDEADLAAPAGCDVLRARRLQRPAIVYEKLHLHLHDLGPQAADRRQLPVLSARSPTGSSARSIEHLGHAGLLDEELRTASRSAGAAW